MWVLSKINDFSLASLPLELTSKGNLDLQKSLGKRNNWVTLSIAVSIFFTQNEANSSWFH